MPLTKTQLADVLADECMEDMRRLADELEQAYDRWMKYMAQYGTHLSFGKQVELAACASEVVKRMSPERLSGERDD